MSEQSDLDEVVAVWCGQPVESRVFSTLEIRRAVARIENEARGTIGALVAATIFTMGVWIALAVVSHNVLSRVGAGLTAAAYAWNVALAIHRRRQLATACMAVSELPSIEYYGVLRDIDRHIRLAGGGWPAYLGLVVPPLLFFLAEAVAHPSSWLTYVAIGFVYVAIPATLIPWGRRNAIANYDEMARYKESRGLL